MNSLRGYQKMSTTAEFISNVQTEIEGLQQKIANLEEQKESIDTQVIDLRNDIKRRNDLLLVWEGKADVRPMVERRPRQRSRRGFTMNSIIIEILDHSDKPMTAHEILEGLIERSAEGNSKSPISSVRNALQILKKRGHVVSPGYGLICLPGKENVGSGIKTIRRPAPMASEEDE